MVEALFYMAVGAAFYHFCPMIARGVWSQLKRLGNIKLPF